MTGILSVCVGAQLILLQQCEAGNDFVLRHQERIVQIHETDSWPWLETRALTHDITPYSLPFLILTRENCVWARKQERVFNVYDLAAFNFFLTSANLLQWKTGHGN